MVILKAWQAIEDLDLWPHDEVWTENWGLVGNVNSFGVFIPHIGMN